MNKNRICTSQKFFERKRHMNADQRIKKVLGTLIKKREELG